MIKKKLTLLFLLIFSISLTSAGNYGAGTYGSGVYGGGEVISSITPSGGGSCTYNWQCTEWFPSTCPESGIQERICVNRGTCSGKTGMPNQTRTCEYLGPSEPLFDIYLTLEDEYKEICPGDKIRANVKLENYARVELLDAFMTYWIVDENNKLIAELKDTRAVEKESSFNIALKIPSSTPSGTYRIYAQITYSGNKTAVTGESFVILSKEDCNLFPQINKIYLIYGIVGVFLILFILILIKLFKTGFKITRKKRKTGTYKEYKKKIKRNLKKIRSKRFLIFLFSFMAVNILLITGKTMIGFAVNNSSSESGNWNILWFILSAILLGFIFGFRKKISKIIKMKKRDKHPKESIKGLIKKKVYSEDGDYIGEIESVLLTENRINSLIIKLNKKQFKVKGAIVKYKDVKGVGHIVIIDREILEKLNI